MAQPVGIGLISCAHNHGAMWGEAFTKDERCRLRAVWDDVPERGLGAAERLKAHFEPDLDKMLADRAIAGVAVASEHGRHADLVIRAARAGKHILCEKPMATTLVDCDRMIAAVNGSGVTFVQGFQMRHDPHRKAVKDLVENGEIGRVVSVQLRHSHSLGFTGWPHGYSDWLWDPVLSGGGAGMDMLVHSCDWLRWMFGEPLSVMAETMHALGRAVEDNIYAIYRMKNGVAATLQSSWTEMAAAGTTQIIGDQGCIAQTYTDGSSVTPDRIMPPVVIWKKGDKAWRRPNLGPGWGAQTHHDVARSFVSTLAEGAPAAATLEDGRKAVEMVLGAYRSAVERRAVYFPLT